MSISEIADSGDFTFVMCERQRQHSTQTTCKLEPHAGKMHSKMMRKWDHFLVKLMQDDVQKGTACWYGTYSRI